MQYAILAALAVQPAGAATLSSSATPYPGVSYEVWVEASIPARAHVLRLDLSSQELHLIATREGERGVTPSAFAAAAGAQMAINGDFFSPAGYAPAGLAMGSAELWTDTSDDATSGFVRFDRNGDVNHAEIVAPASVVAPGDLPTGTQGVVGGRPMLVQAGVAVTTFDCTDAVAMPCERAPRTAVALSADGATLFLVVVDGWQAGSVGMTAAELAAFVRSLGAANALMLDGGGAAAMYVAAEGGVVSTPSDGVERPVANHLAVAHGALPPGQLVGFIRERDVFDEAASIAGATALLDDGRSVVTGADGRYSFTNVSPRYACVTASAPGYRTETSCRQVVSGALTYNSIALYPNSDFIDAAPGAPDASGPADAAPAGPDAGGIADGGAGVGPDAGEPGVGGTCGCRASDSDPVLSWLALCFAAVILVRSKQKRS